MFGILDWVKIAGGIAIGVLLTSVYWLGIPLLNDYPILRNIPLIGPLAVGHVEAVKADALKGYVLETEKTAAEAKASEMERQRNAASQALDDHRKRLEAAQASEQAAKTTLEQEISGYERILSEKNRACLVSKEDSEWLRRH